MALSKNIIEYEDCREHMDRALASANGIRITVRDKGQAIHLRQRMYKLRQLEKIQSTNLYEIGDERRLVTPYDNLVITVNDNAVEIRHGVPAVIEEL